MLFFRAARQNPVGDVTEPAGEGLCQDTQTSRDWRY